MTARDVDTSPTQHRTWVVTDQLDMTGQYYDGYKGGPNPLDEVYAYPVGDGYIVDFNLMNPTEWATTYRTLPEPTYDAHILVMDEYIFLFGGMGSDKIFSSTIGNPAYVLDTYQTLPSSLGGGQLAVLDGYSDGLADGYVFIFGGNDGYATDKIYGAAIGDLLTWKDYGSLLPRALYDAQLYMDGNNLYLYGGNDGYGPTNVILSASVADPLTWSESVATLPDNLTNSHILVANNYIYLIGGLVDGYPTANVYVASDADPTSWSLGGSLPYPAHSGQLVTIGNSAYLFATDIYDPQVYGTKIYTCNKSFPLTSWEDTGYTIPGSLAQSQLAFVGDRMFMFGGNGSSIIFTHSYDVIYEYNDPVAVAYGDVTRTQYQAVTDGYQKTQVLGFPYWKTDY